MYMSLCMCMVVQSGLRPAGEARPLGQPWQASLRVRCGVRVRTWQAALESASPAGAPNRPCSRCGWAGSEATECRRMGELGLVIYMSLPVFTVGQNVL